MVWFMNLFLTVRVLFSSTSLGFTMSAFTWIPIPSIFTTPFPVGLIGESPNLKMAPLCRFEPDGAELLDINPNIAQLFDKIGWGDFLRAFSGHNVEVTRRFALTLKENVAHIGDIILEIYEDFIANATNLPQIGECWFKKKEVNHDKWRHFLLPLPEGFNDKNGFLIKYLQPQWETLFHMIVRYITCDGRCTYDKNALN